MLDLKYFGDAINELEAALVKRNVSIEMLNLVQKSVQERRGLIQKVEGLKADRNRVTQDIAILKSKGKSDPNAAKDADQKILEMRTLGEEIKKLDEQLKTVEASVSDMAMSIANIPHVSVPSGNGAEQNQEVRRVGTPRIFDFEPKDHVTLGENLKILDFERAGKMSGARFSIYLGAGATLERALIQFMLDLHTRVHGYQEVIPPFMVTRESMKGTGQLPKFEEDLFKTYAGDRELFLIPTSEVPLTNIYRDEVIEPGKLPFFFTAYSPCFRSEAGSYGKDTRGLIRQHQFQKVELVKLCEPEASYVELEAMVSNAESVLTLLGLPFRTILLCGGDMGFSAAKTYDIEVWLPAPKTYREISSCSNCEDFQARRAQIRFKKASGDKTRLVHTLNGSGLAVGRTFVAILENYQDAQGNIEIPKVLHKYVDGASGFTREGDKIWIRG